MKTKSKPCSLKVYSDDGRELVGTAAQLRYINLRGGWDQHTRALYREIAQAVALQVSDALSTQVLAAQAQKQHTVAPPTEAAHLLSQVLMHTSQGETHRVH